MHFFCEIRLASVFFALIGCVFCSDGRGQNPPYDVFPEAVPPVYRIRYQAPERPSDSTNVDAAKSQELEFAVNFTIWIPPNAEKLRGVIVHQHGCGEGSCKSGLSGAFDLHWQALAAKHDCALLAPSYEQPADAECQRWCDPRNGSSDAFLNALKDLGQQSQHPELATIPWALWGHSGGGHWCGGMVMLHPERVAAAWLRSGVPFLEANPERTEIKPYEIPDAALQIPIMCNLGTKEGVSVTDGRFAKVWPVNEKFFNTVRGKGGLIAVAVDPLTSHECGNQRYFAIPWLDACLTARLPRKPNESLRTMPTDDVWLAPPTGTKAASAKEYAYDPLKASWFASGTIAKQWMQYATDTNVVDDSAPPAPTNVVRKGNTLTWDCAADVQSGLAHFIIRRDGKFLARVPENGKNRFGRPLFQNLLYSDTPTQPLAQMKFTDQTANESVEHQYEVIAVNTARLKSKPTAAQTVTK